MPSEPEGIRRANVNILELEFRVLNDTTALSDHSPFLYESHMKKTLVIYRYPGSYLANAKDC